MPGGWTIPGFGLRFGWATAFALTCAVCAAEEAAPARAVRLEPVGGAIQDASGAPIAGAEIELYHCAAYGNEPSRPCGSAVSDQIGQYSFGPLPAGDFRIAVAAPGFARAFAENHIRYGSDTRLDAVLAPPIVSVIQIKDEEGQPVAGASVRRFELRGVNGTIRFSQTVLSDLDIDIAKSDETGRIELPALAEGDSLVDIDVEHPRFPPDEIKRIKIAAGSTTEVTLPRGVMLNVRAVTDSPGKLPRRAWLALRRERSAGEPAIYSHREITFDELGTARVPILPGDYGIVKLNADDCFLLPASEEVIPRGGVIHFDRGRDHFARFNVVMPDAIARGRIVDRRSGRPLPGVTVHADTLARSWPVEKFERQTKTDAQGEFTIALAAGPAKLSVGNSRDDSWDIAKLESVKCDLAANGTTDVGDIRVERVPPLAGTVQNPDGSPAAGVVVHFDPGRVDDSVPILTDEAGRFEFQPDWRTTGLCKVHALDPYRPLAVRIERRLGEPGEMLLKLEEHEPGWLMDRIIAEGDDWDKGVLPPDKKDQYEAVSLRGKIPPELEGAEWLNTGGKPLKLADLKGKYVLLVFWIGGCGDYAIPSVKLVDRLYKDKGVVVIGVNTGLFQMHEETWRYRVKTSLRFPVVIDRSKLGLEGGPILAGFKRHGLKGWLNHILIGPDGTVLLDDATIPYPSLDDYTLEIIRDFLLGGSADREARLRAGTP